MHQCLEIPEIFGLIFELIMNDAPSAKSRRTLLALALTHHGFKAVALDVLWHTQTSLVPLIKCTPDDLWEESPVGFDRDLVSLWFQSVNVGYFNVHLLVFHPPNCRPRLHQVRLLRLSNQAY